MFLTKTFFYNNFFSCQDSIPHFLTHDTTAKNCLEDTSLNYELKKHQKNVFFTEFISQKQLKNIFQLEKIFPTLAFRKGTILGFPKNDTATKDCFWATLTGRFSKNRNLAKMTNLHRSRQNRKKVRETYSWNHYHFPLHSDLTLPKPIVCTIFQWLTREEGGGLWRVIP